MDKSAKIGEERDERLLMRVMECWNSLRGFREERERCKRFTYGDQWVDTVVDGGVRMREEDLIRRQGNLPLKNNLIRRLVRNVLGVYRNQWSMPKCEWRDPSESKYAATMNELLACNVEINRLEELYARTMEEFLISGMAVHKKWYGEREGRVDCWTEQVSPGRFFVDFGSRDIRGGDLSLVGELHEMRYEELAASFAHTPKDLVLLSELLGGGKMMSGGEICSVYEVWERRKEVKMRCHDRETAAYYELPMRKMIEIEEENDRRHRQRRPKIKVGLKVETKWCYKFLTAAGDVLASGESPYRHGSHPYIIKCYPFIDGEIHSFVSDIIDQQKLTNRLISMYDWILRASAKGVLLFPEGAFPDGVDINDVADEWGRFNGVIVYRPRSGVPLPQQVSSKSADIGITQLLEIQMSMMEDISGVNGALQGKLESGSISGTLYNQQTRNSMTALADLLKSFADFEKCAAAKDVSNIMQYYTEDMIRRVVGIRSEMSTTLKETMTFGDSLSDFRIQVTSEER